jgi:sporulation protein YlmC with PRC-barrel domain
MRLIDEVLDAQIYDADGIPIGRADGIVLEIREGRPPRVSAIEVGPITLLRRFSDRLAARYARLDRHFGPGRGVAFRIPFSSLAIRTTHLQSDLRAEETPILAAEDWLRTHIVAYLPGGK